MWGKACVFPAVFMAAGKSPVPLGLEDGWKPGDHAWPALLTELHTGEVQYVAESASGAGLEPEYVKFQNAPGVMNFCTLGY